MSCASQYTVDKKWYRAKIIGLPGNRMVEVFYVDYGNQEVVAWSLIRKLHTRFLRIAAQVNIPFQNTETSLIREKVAENIFYQIRRGHVTNMRLLIEKYAGRVSLSWNEGPFVHTVSRSRW
jgi:energy-coupling factor transporter ATP-binding protein EcfA2